MIVNHQWGEGRGKHHLRQFFEQINVLYYNFSNKRGSVLVLS